MKYPQLTSTTVLLLLSLLPGCTGLDVLKPQPDNSVFFILGVSTARQSLRTGEAGAPAVLIGPASLAKYLDQSHIVSFKGDNELVYSDTYRWAEPLEEGINRILIDRLSSELGSPDITTVRLQPGMEADYRVGYQVQQLGGKPGKSVRLDMDWWIGVKDSAVTHYKTTLVNDNIPGGADNYGAYVRAIEELVTTWAGEVADTIRQLNSN